MSASKKSKYDQIPKPISIKKEKSEEDRTLQPISHYIDDRLELVKQIFGTLKPKTIMNLAPEFLKKTSLDEIEELCLNELLCISTKRLKSIIADTICPTDTESSEDSDVEHKKEHVSLEEISSDSDIGGHESRRAKKLRKSSAKKADKTSENKEPDGQISVLELLELQARARAIRSQLAMEPITKIEVKSDDDDDEKQSARQKQLDKEKEKRAQRPSGSSKHRSSEATTSKPISRSQTQKQYTESKPKEISVPQKKIKLKRNYRNPKTPEKQLESKTTLHAKPNTESDHQHKSRSASPDVIQIPAEPETLLISDSTDDESKNESGNRKGITAKDQGPIAPAAPAPPPAEESEPEEGEVRDESETEIESETKAEIDEPQQKSTESEVKTDTKAEEAVPAVEMMETKDKEETLEASNSKEVIQPAASAEESIVDDEDQNEDVISIGGDLEHEMIEELANVADETDIKVKSEASKKLEGSYEEDNDVISLNTSEDEQEKLQESNSESWRTRYLKSSKVSQVLAASRLGKRVRDKIKKSKRAEKHSEGKEVAAEKASQQQQFTSKHEDGSIEQYQELLQHRQRKTSNGSKGDK